MLLLGNDLGPRFSRIFLESLHCGGGIVAQTFHPSKNEDYSLESPFSITFRANFVVLRMAISE